MSSQSQLPLSRILVLSAVAAVLIALTALPITAQNSVSPTAVQAARTPEWAKRLAHPANRSATLPKPARARQAPRNGPPQGNDVYDNGPINGNTDAWTINFGFIVSDTFTVTVDQTSITGMSFGAWLFPGDTLTSAELSITSEPNGGTSYFNQTVNFTQQGGCTSNEFAFNICTETTTFNGPMLNAGTYWVNLQNAQLPSGDPIYWDENSGEGCESTGCPSQAYDNSIGSIPSESFTILGNNTSSCPSPAHEENPPTAAKVVTVPPSPTLTYRVIYSFTGGADGGVPTAGLVIDGAGNLYGTTSSGGPSGDGTVFKLVPRDSGWIFNRLYSFSGADGSSPNSSLVLGIDGSPIGTAGGGGLGDGVLFGLSPAANVLPSVFSNWMEDLLYSFTGGSDGADPGGSLVLDSSGNIYGNAATGGANHGGTLYEFTNGGIEVLHSFPAFNGDGTNPLGVVNISGDLYGVTESGGTQHAGTLYTTAGGYQVLYNFTSEGPDYVPTNLATDQAGNLYGSASSVVYICKAPGGEEPAGNVNIYQFSPPSWNPSLLTYLQYLGYSQLAKVSVSTDALGNVYGITDSYGFQGLGNVFELTCCWNGTNLHNFTGSPNDGANPTGTPIVDPQGNIYGTTKYGGANGFGVVWEISP